MLSTFAAVAAAALLQSAPAAPTNDQLIEAKTGEIFELTTRMMFVMGSCETIFSAIIGQDFKAQAFSQIDATTEPGRVFLKAWEEGSQSPQAASMTMETCATTMQPISEEMQKLSEELQPLLQQN